MGRNLLIAVLFIGVIGLGLWGYQEHRAKNALILRNENNYQQAYNELTYYVDKIHDSLGASLATDKRSTSAPQLAEVWRLTNQARNDIGKLPLGLASFNDTSSFLGDLGNFSYNTGIKHPNANGLTGSDYQQLETLYNESSNIEQSLRGVQSSIINNNLKWTDVAEAVNSKQPQDNQIVDGLETVNQQVSSFQKTMPPTIDVSFNNMKKLNELNGDSINKGDAMIKVKHDFNIPADTKVQAQTIGNGATYKGYNVSYKDDKHNETVTVNLTQKGGHLVLFMKNRTIGKQKLSLHQAVLKANQYLKKQGYKGYEATVSDQYDTIGVITFSKKDQNVVVYPDNFKLKVALDNGEILGFDQTDHLIASKTDLPSFKPSISEKQAKQGIRESVTIKDSRLVVYQNENGNDVLCYEFLATKSNDTYRILINAKTGVEEDIRMLTV
ncbi:germination protein YpeB [Pullulanibacillus sp. KACC 23026]|uniref:germination protein YpeB n=1 Tax=Pullulanibacillus sp. KACC 23026 TaxID=3028315 RepID=UPI0023B1A15A|nr:germination protein YpeB [Pullulanibacillus sp. KACC 23026]WEG11394.1 germination protein YpeB [Pullulanibacillus sp. KACC 23026]